MEAKLFFENENDAENTMTVVFEAGKFSVSVSDEQAVDSYNETFECCILLDVNAARHLRDFLNAHLG